MADVFSVVHVVYIYYWVAFSFPSAYRWGNILCGINTTWGPDTNHREMARLPASRDSKIWSRVPRESESSMTVLARTSSNLPDPTTITSTPGDGERERRFPKPWILTTYWLEGLITAPDEGDISNLRNVRYQLHTYTADRPSRVRDINVRLWNVLWWPVIESCVRSVKVRSFRDVSSGLQAYRPIRREQPSCLRIVRSWKICNVIDFWKVRI
jgi:hypothetical protein